MSNRLGPAARQLAETFRRGRQRKYDVTELDGIVPHLSGSEIAAGLKELRLCRLVTIHEGIPTSSRDVSPELAKIDHVELLPFLMEDE